LPAFVAGTRRVTSAGYGTRRVPTTPRMRKSFFGRSSLPPKTSPSTVSLLFLRVLASGLPSVRAGRALHSDVAPSDEVAGTGVSWTRRPRASGPDAMSMVISSMPVVRWNWPTTLPTGRGPPRDDTWTVFSKSSVSGTPRREDAWGKVIEDSLRTDVLRLGRGGRRLGLAAAFVRSSCKRATINCYASLAYFGPPQFPPCGRISL